MKLKAGTYAFGNTLMELLMGRSIGISEEKRLQQKTIAQRLKCEAIAFERPILSLNLYHIIIL